MKSVEQLKPNFAPSYLAMYPELCRICQRHGYALAVHGSLARDFDLVAIPWAETVASHSEVLAEIEKTFVVNVIPPNPKGGYVWERKNHGRIAYTISVGFGECAIDLSFMPAICVSSVPICG
jgi:hypothetical protein